MRGESGILNQFPGNENKRRTYGIKSVLKGLAIVFIVQAPVLCNYAVRKACRTTSVMFFVDGELLRIIIVLVTLRQGEK